MLVIPDSPAPKPTKGEKPKTTKKPTSTQQTKPKTKPSIAKTTKSTLSQPPKHKPAPAKPQEKKRKRALDAAEAPSLAKRSKAGRISKKRTLQLRDEFIDEGAPTIETQCLMMKSYLAKGSVFREPDSGKLQPLPEVQGKGKEKAHSAKQNPLDSLSNLSSLYVELGLTDSGTESDEEVSSEMSAQGQEEGQGGTNPGDTGMSQTPSSHVVHVGPNLDHMDLGITKASSQPNTKQMDDEFTANAYPKVQENLKLPSEGEVRLEEPTSSAGTLSSMKNLNKDLSFTNQFLVEKSHEDEPEKTNTEAEVQSMVTVPILQDTLSVPLMTTPVIDIIDPQSDSTTVPASMPTTTTTVTETTTTTTTTTVLPPPQPQHDVSTLILIQTIGQLEQKIADLVDANQALEKRIDKQGNRIHQLESQDLSRLIREQTVEFIDSQEIDRKIEESVKEVVTASVQHVMRAPLRASGTTGASDFAQDPPLPPPSLTTNRGDQSHSSAALGSSKTTASTAYIAWTTTTSRLTPTASSFPEDHHMVSLTDGSRDSNSTSTDAQLTPIEELLSPEPPTAQRQEDSLYCHQLMDKKFGYQKKVERLPCSHREPVSETRVRNADDQSLLTNEIQIQFWTKNDVIKSKQFMFAIQKRLKLRQIFRNLESFVGGRIREGDYRLLQRTE
ncbi:hypothetical protein Tco_0822192 [Tanacetum coccineum]|uniref:Uncharacterized protein n=1 Tax=Tanacetum coccineum TaxID=301880 RepID=A0ABQ5AIP6_9ASTR